MRKKLRALGGGRIHNPNASRRRPQQKPKGSSNSLALKLLGFRGKKKIYGNLGFNPEKVRLHALALAAKAREAGRLSQHQYNILRRRLNSESQGGIARPLGVASGTVSQAEIKAQVHLRRQFISGLTQEQIGNLSNDLARRLREG